MKEKFKKSKKLYIAATAIIVCLILAIVIIISWSKAKPSFVGTWVLDPISEETKTNLTENKNMTFSKQFEDASTINLKLEPGIFGPRAILSVMGMQQEGSWGASDDNNGEINIGRTNAEMVINGDTLIVQRGDTVLTLKKQ